MLVFFDTNILLYAARPAMLPGEEEKRVIAINLVAESDFAVSGQVLAEFYHNSVRKGEHRLSHDQAIDWLDRLAEQTTVSVDVAVVKAGAAISHRYQISYWDGAIIAAANEIGATIVYSEDLNDGQIYGAVKVVNPFKSVIH
jgi:predicted nucleic acid-binding protein